MIGEYVYRASTGTFARRSRCQNAEFLASIAPCKKGTNNPHAKLTDETAMRVFLSPWKHEAIAAEFGISVQQVRKIKQKKMWKHIHEHVEALAAALG